MRGAEVEGRMFMGSSGEVRHKVCKTLGRVLGIKGGRSEIAPRGEGGQSMFCLLVWGAGESPAVGFGSSQMSPR